MDAYELHPVDTLFYRDARPMESGAGSGGHGGVWPLPTALPPGQQINRDHHSSPSRSASPAASAKAPGFSGKGGCL